MKKVILLLIIILFPINALADTGKSTIVMEIESGRILYKNNAENKRLIASITKIMTCLIVLENVDIKKEIIVGNEILNTYGTNIYLEVGEKIKIEDLLYGLMLRSGNDAAITLAEKTLGEKSFVNKMNEKAREIGMSNTHFENPHGLDDSTRNYSTAYDMALLSRYAYNNKIYRKIISTKKYITKTSKKNYTWYNRMSLLNQYKDCIGGKNGYTPNAGKTLVSYAKKDDMVLTIISLDDKDIYSNHQFLYNYYFKKYNKYLIVDKNKFKIFPIVNSNKYYIKKSFKYPLSADETEKVTTLVKIENQKENNMVGEVIINFNNKKIGSINIYEKKSKKKKDISIFQKILN